MSEDRSISLQPRLQFDGRYIVCSSDLGVYQWDFSSFDILRQVKPPQPSVEPPSLTHPQRPRPATHPSLTATAGWRPPVLMTAGRRWWAAPVVGGAACTATVVSSQRWSFPQLRVSHTLAEMNEISLQTLS